MLTFSAKGVFLARLACVFLLPVIFFLSAALYLSGSKWAISILVIVTVLLCIHWPLSLRDRLAADRAAAEAGLPVLHPEPPEPAHDERVRQQCGGVRGLGASAIAALPAYAYEKKAGADDCAVCLGELQRGEAVKRLPACAHLFHDACIDAWLRSHVTCPVCRSLVDAAMPVAAQVVVVQTQ